MQSDIHRERLEKLADFLDHLPLIPRKKEFSLVIWKIEDRDCKTAACAIGWATEIFSAEGLTLVNILGGFVPEFGKLRNWEAVEGFFKLSPQMARSLFSAGAYPSDQWEDPKAVARKINTYLKRNWK